MARLSAPAHRPGRGRRSRRCRDEPPARLREGIEQFNRGEFFEQHETLELEWIEETDPVRYLYQGILQVGVGFEHLGRGNTYGARRLWRRGIGYLAPFRGGCMGVDVDRLIAETERCLTELDRVGGALERFDRSLIPRVEWLQAIGDVTGIWPLTYVGKYQGRVVASNILGEPREVDYSAVPRVVFTDPQAAAVGEAEGQGTATVPLAEVSRTATYTRTYDSEPSFMTLISDGERLTGAYAVGPEAASGSNKRPWPYARTCRSR